MSGDRYYAPASTVLMYPHHSGHPAVDSLDVPSLMETTTEYAVHDDDTHMFQYEPKN